MAIICLNIGVSYRYTIPTGKIPVVMEAPRHPQDRRPFSEAFVATCSLSLYYVVLLSSYY